MAHAALARTKINTKSNTSGLQPGIAGPCGTAEARPPDERPSGERGRPRVRPEH